MIEEKDEFNFNFDVLDPTKVWPEEQVPVKIIGKMTLNKNPDNYFAETEQVAFHPGHVVPGLILRTIRFFRDDCSRIQTHSFRDWAARTSMKSRLIVRCARSITISGTACTA